MIDIFLATQLIAANPETQKFCAEVVGIPYASDNFTDEEWERFQKCMAFFERHQTPLGAPVSAPAALPLPVVPYDPSLPALDA